MSIKAKYLFKNPFLFGVVIVLLLLFGNFTGRLDLIDDSQVDISSDKNSVKSRSASLEGFVTVTRVIDGDTINVSRGFQNATVRLIGVDTPETVHPRKKVECFGKEASDFTKEKLLGQMVKLVSDSSQSNKDKYGRLLRYVFLEDGTNFNQYLIREGLAYEYTYKSNYRYQVPFKAAQLFAETEKKGFWGEGACDGF